MLHDECTLTSTNRLDGWSDVRHHLMRPVDPTATAITAPGTARATEWASDQPNWTPAIRINYPTVGDYVFVVTTSGADVTLGVAPVQVQPREPNFVVSEFSFTTYGGRELEYVEDGVERPANAQPMTCQTQATKWTVAGGAVQGRRGLAVDDDGNVAFGSRADNKVRVHDENGKFLRATSFDAAVPSGLAFVGKDLFVVTHDEDGQHVNKVDAQGQPVATVRIADKAPAGLTFGAVARNPATGELIAVVLRGSEAVAVVLDTNLQERVRFSLGTFDRNWVGDLATLPFAIDAQGRPHMLTWNNTVYTLRIFDGTGRLQRTVDLRTADTVPMGHDHWGLALDSDGTIVTIDDRNARMRWLSVSGNTAVLLRTAAALDDKSGGLAFAPDGTFLAISARDGHITRVPTCMPEPSELPNTDLP
jgi:hypothetical protein